MTPSTLVPMNLLPGRATSCACSVPPSTAPAAIETVCAWCFPPVPGRLPGMSHGICARHKPQVLAGMYDVRKELVGS